MPEQNEHESEQPMPVGGLCILPAFSHSGKRRLRNEPDRARFFPVPDKKPAPAPGHSRLARDFVPAHISETPRTTEK